MDSQRSLTWLKWGLHAGGGLLTIGIAVGAWWGIDRLVNSRIQHLERRFAATKAFMESRPTIEAEHCALRVEVEQKGLRFAELLARIPADARESDFLSQVSELAERCELAIRDYRPGSIAAHPRHNELEIVLSAEGSYAAVCRFLDGIDSLPRLSRVTALQVAVPADVFSDRYPVDMTLRIYFSQLHSTL